MGSIKEQLMDLGFKPKGQGVSNLEKQINTINQKKSVLSDHFTCFDLDQCSTARDFKRVAKNILHSDWTLIQEIINKAHTFKGEGGKKLIWFCYQIRDGLMICPSNRQDQFLDRVFRKNGATFEIPPDWK